MRRALIYTHRWLGIGGCLLFLAWFASGIVMMYARMPELRRSDRLSRLTPIRPEAIRISPADAVRIGGVAPSAIHLSTLEGRPVYRLSSAREAVTVFADSGDMLDGVTIPRLRAAIDALASKPRDVEIVQFRGEPYLVEIGRAHV